MLNGVNVNFVIKFPMMLSRAMLMIGAFAVAFGGRESLGHASNRVAATVFGD